MNVSEYAHQTGHSNTALSAKYTCHNTCSASTASFSKNTLAAAGKFVTDLPEIAGSKWTYSVSLTVKRTSADSDRKMFSEMFACLKTPQTEDGDEESRSSWMKQPNAVPWLNEMYVDILYQDFSVKMFFFKSHHDLLK